MRGKYFCKWFMIVFLTSFITLIKNGMLLHKLLILEIMQAGTL